MLELTSPGQWSCLGRQRGQHRTAGSEPGLAGQGGEAGKGAPLLSSSPRGELWLSAGGLGVHTDSLEPPM